MDSQPKTDRLFVFGSFPLRTLWVILRDLMTVIFRNYVPRALCLVRHRKLDLPGCCDPLSARQTCPRHGTSLGARLVRRLGSRNLFSPWDARRQPDRQGPGTRRGIVRGFKSNLEGSTIPVCQFRLNGRRSRRERCECLLSHLFETFPSPPAASCLKHVSNVCTLPRFRSS